MSFRTSTTLDEGFKRARDLAKQEKAYLQNWSTKLAGTISGLDAYAWSTNLKRIIAELTAISALPGIVAYAQDQYGDSGYNVAAEFNAMLVALQNCLDWLIANIPANAVYISNGELAGNNYTPSQTASFLTLVNTAIVTIE